MTVRTIDQRTEAPARSGAEHGDVSDLAALIDQSTRSADWPHATEIVSNVPVYDGEAVRAAAAEPIAAARLQDEFEAAFDRGPGAIAVRNALPDGAVIDRATEIFAQLIDAERAVGAGAGDHFAKPGANDRVWNALQKHALADPENFALYYGAAALAAPARAWLGDGYQMTAQVNRVNPGGAAQSPHRDYHLGFMAPARMALFPASVHALSPRLTLQGGVAHGDTPIEAGPTQLLPYSQLWPEGYLAAGRDDVRAIFAARRIQIPLAKGDALFFNPALLHAAGENRTSNVRRTVNLLQISSAFGRAMETVDRTAVASAVYPALLRLTAGGALSDAAAGRAIAAAAEGYAFPTNLDRDPPIGGAAPETDVVFLERALIERRSAQAVIEELQARRARRTA